MRWAPQAPERAAPYPGWPRGPSGGLPQLRTFSQPTEVMCAGHVCLGGTLPWMGAARGSEECLLSEWGQGVTVPFLSVQAKLEQLTLSS